MYKLHVAFLAHHDDHRMIPFARGHGHSHTLTIQEAVSAPAAPAAAAAVTFWGSVGVSGCLGPVGVGLQTHRFVRRLHACVCVAHKHKSHAIAARDMHAHNFGPR